MNRGRLGYITDDSKIQLAPEIFERLGLVGGSALFGLYYPKNPNDPSREHTSVADDFMLTPLHPLLWDRSAIMIVRLKHGPNNFHQLAKYLDENHFSIFFSEFSRSGYRYDTWSLHLAAVGLEDTLTYDKSTGCHKETTKCFKNLQRQLRRSRHFNNILFVDQCEAELQNPVQLLPLTALSYFSHLQRQKVRRVSYKRKFLFEPIKMRVEGNGLIIPEGDTFSRLAKHIESRHGRFINGSVCFCEADRRNFNMRLAVLTQEMAQQIFVIHALYRSDGNHQDFRGLLAGISHKFNKYQTVWKCSNEKHEVHDHHEKGMLKLIIEDRTPGATQDEKLNALQSLVWQFDKAKFAKRTSIVAVQGHVATRAYVEERINHDLGEQDGDGYDVFISYSHKQRRRAHRLKTLLEDTKTLKVWMDERQIEGGHTFPERIARGLMSSQEMILLWSEDAVKSDWMKTEWSVFWFLNQRNSKRLINPVLVDTTPANLPEPLRTRHCVEYTDTEQLQKLVQDIQLRAVLSRKLSSGGSKPATGGHFKTGQSEAGDS